MPRKRTPLEERFWKKVNKTDSCWLWTGFITRDGYGKYSIKADRGIVTKRPHRMAYELLVGHIPEGLHIDHLCGVRHCVNPTHLEPVTQAENNRRSNAPGHVRRRERKCAKGHPYTPKNGYWRPDGRWRCRVCYNAARRARDARKRATV